MQCTHLVLNRDVSNVGGLVLSCVRLSGGGDGGLELDPLISLR